MADEYMIDKGELSDPLQLLLAIVAGGDSLQRWRERSRSAAEMNWIAFMQLAKHHRVYPYVYRRLKEAGGGLVPEDVLRSFGNDYRRNTFAMLQLSGETENVCRLFGEHGIRLLLLKGPVLAVELYGDISLRTSCDLDVLIDIRELERAEALLTARGYEKDDYIHAVLGDWKWRHHHTTFIHPVTGIKIELHWRLNPAPSKEPGFEKLWSRRRRSPISEYPVYYPGREDLFLFLVTHGARHGWSRLRWLLDIRQMIDRYPESGKLRAHLLRYRADHIGGQAIVLATRLLDAKPDRALQSLARGTRPAKLAQEAMFYVERMVQLHSLPLPEDVERYHKRHLRQLMTRRQRAQFYASYLFPYPEDAETLPLPKPLHFLYLPLRPVLWAFRKANKPAVQKAGE